LQSGNSSEVGGPVSSPEAQKTEDLWSERKLASHSFLLLLLALLHNLKQRVDLAMDRLIREMLQGSGTGRALRITESVSFTKDRIDPGLSPLWCIHKLYSAIFAD
jgi:hypothetical protein